MDSFEELGLDPQVVEALASEGIERPTSLQVQAIPVLRRGTSVVLQAAPGSGLLVAYGVALLERTPSATGHPTALVLTPERERARDLALSLARLASSTGHRVGALGVPWAGPAESDIVFSTLEDVREAVTAAGMKTEQLSALVLDGASSVLERVEASKELADVLQALTGEGLQTVVVSDPVTRVVRRWVEGHVRRGVFLPAEAATDRTPAAPVQRGTLRVYTMEDDIDITLPSIIAGKLDEGHSHVLVFSRSEDRAADLGDLLVLHGFGVGRPGDSGATIWLGVDPLEARAALESAAAEAPSVAVVSADVPGDVDELDRRHGGPALGGTVMIYPRELPHLRSMSREAGYALEPVEKPSLSAGAEAARFLAEVEAALDEEDLVPYLGLLEPVIRTRGAAAVAGALAALLRKKPRSSGSPPDHTSRDQDRPATGPAANRPPAWARLFLSVGVRDGIAAKDLLGAITGEAGIRGDHVGRIEVKESFSRVEVHDAVADRVIRSINGTSIRGRSVRADYDRGEMRTKRKTPPRREGVRGGGRSKGG